MCRSNGHNTLSTFLCLERHPPRYFVRLVGRRQFVALVNSSQRLFLDTIESLEKHHVERLKETRTDCELLLSLLKSGNYSKCKLVGRGTEKLPPLWMLGLQSPSRTQASIL